MKRPLSGGPLASLRTPVWAGAALAGVLLALAAAAPAAPGREGRSRQPHILFLLADDLGWKDVGFHGSEIRTPHLDALAEAGTRLEQFYVMPVCSPTRASLMTGRYPMRYGLQSGVVRPWARYGLPLEERTLPQALKEAGYTTAITGKWHLGHFQRAYLPTRRGFDHQYGHYNGALDYFTHVRDGGFDWHRNDQVNRDAGYTTELLGKEAVRLIDTHDARRPLFLYVPFNAPHAPLQAPAAYLDRYPDIRNARRRTYAAMVSAVDDAVGSIVAALDRRGMRDDTLIVFSSDNGGPTQQAANNGPLRANKGTLYEGGIRVPAFAVWPGSIPGGTVVDEPVHMVDWYPTLLRLGGASLRQPLPVDGRDIWATVARGEAAPRRDLLLNVEPDEGAIRRGPWKLVYRGALPLPAGAPAGKAELFHLDTDPHEKSDLSAAHPERVKELLGRLDRYARQAVPPNGGPNSPQRAGWQSPAVFGEAD